MAVTTTDPSTTDPSTQALLDAEFERNKQPLRASRVLLHIFLIVCIL